MLGAENGARTRDLNLGKVALYQLSYFRVSGMQRYDIFLAFASFFCTFLHSLFIFSFCLAARPPDLTPLPFAARPPRSAASPPLGTRRATAFTVPSQPPGPSSQPPPSDRHCPQRPLGSHLPIPYDGPAVLDINFDYAVAGDLAFEDGA